MSALTALASVWPKWARDGELEASSASPAHASSEKRADHGQSGQGDLWRQDREASEEQLIPVTEACDATKMTRHDRLCLEARCQDILGNVWSLPKVQWCDVMSKANLDTLASTSKSSRARQCSLTRLGLSSEAAFARGE